MDPLATGCIALGIHAAHFGNHWSRSYGVELQDNLWTMTWKQCERSSQGLTLSRIQTSAWGDSMQPQKYSIRIDVFSSRIWTWDILYIQREYYTSYGSMQSHTASYLPIATDAKFLVPSTLMTSILNLTFSFPKKIWFQE